jgi:hypothetical protein
VQSQLQARVKHRSGAEEKWSGVLAWKVFISVGARSVCCGKKQLRDACAK